MKLFQSKRDNANLAADFQSFGIKSLIVISTMHKIQIIQNVYFQRNVLILKKLITSKELQKIQLDLLCEVDRICRRNNLRYYLCGGTLLGAVRHKGFIPWDDDVDIDMPREDMVKFIELVKDHETIGILGEDNPQYYHCNYKVYNKATVLQEGELTDIPGLGVFIDIFPQDGLPEGEKQARKYHHKVFILQDKLYLFGLNGYPKTGRPLTDIFLVFLWKYEKSKGIGYWRKRYIEAATRYSFEDSTYIFSSGGRYDRKEVKLKSYYEGDAVELEFEGHRFFAPSGYKDILEHFYGDYMQLPPVEKRISHHEFEAYWK